MSLALNNIKESQKGNSLVSWIGIVGVLLLTGILFLAYSIEHDGAAELQTAPLHTLLFIDNSTKTL